MGLAGAGENCSGFSHEVFCAIFGSAGAEAHFLAGGAQERGVDFASGSWRWWRQIAEQITQIGHKVQCDLVLCIERWSDDVAHGSGCGNTAFDAQDLAASGSLMK